MAYKALIDTFEYTLKDGFTIKEELNETLDSGLIIFYTFNEEMTAEPFDYVSIYDDDSRMGTKYMLVDSYEDEIYSYGQTFDSADHQYTMTLFSETKELERVVLPNISITQPLDPDNQISVADKIYEICELYGPKVKVISSAGFTYRDRFEVHSAINTMFRNIKCPEFQWNRPTLREVLTDLMSTKDCIPVVRDGTILFINLNTRGDQIDTTKLLYSKKSMSSSDYVGELSIDLQNAIGKSNTICCEYMRLKNPESESRVTTQNAVFRTQHPIYGIKKVFVYFFEWYQDDGDKQFKHRVRKLDITPYVIEREEFDLLSNVKIDGDLYNGLGDFYDSVNNNRVKKHKGNFLYYERGGTEIANFGTIYNRVGVDGTFITQVLVPIARLGTHLHNLSDPRELILSVEYESVAERSMNVGKYLPAKHPDNRIMDNQSNSYVDVEHQSIFEYAKANRLGNRIREIGGNYPTEFEAPKLGDRIGDEVLFSRELSYWDDMVQFKGFLAPNYILKDFFTGVSAKKRSWQIAKGSEALTRRDVVKLYNEASFSRKRDKIGSFDYDTSVLAYIADVNGYNIVEKLVDGLVAESPFNMVYALSQTYDKNGNSIMNYSKGVLLDTNIEVQGKSLCVNFGYNDNFAACDIVINEDDEYRAKLINYADSNGEFKRHRVRLIGRFNGDGAGHEIYLTPQVGSFGTEYREAVLSAALEKPYVNVNQVLDGNKGVEFYLNINKDNREIIQHSIQFEYCSDTKDIIVGKRLIELSSVINKNAISFNDLRLYTSIYSRDRYELSDVGGRGTAESLNSEKIRIEKIDDFTVGVYLSKPLMRTYESWAITDSTGEILLAVNGNRRTVYFNLLRSRDTNFYQTDKKTPTGNINI